MDSRARRVQKEIKDCREDRLSGIVIDMVGDSLYHLKGSFHGPKSSPYEGGYFIVDIVITIQTILRGSLTICPAAYPFAPPKMKFDTMVYHPNISSAPNLGRRKCGRCSQVQGAICLDILKDQWSPVLTIKSALISLQSLLCEPAPDDPQDAEVARHYKSDRKGFDSTARYWTMAYAGGPSSAAAGHNGTTTGPFAQQRRPGMPINLVAMHGLSQRDVDQFVAFGFPLEKVVEVLARMNYRPGVTNKPNEDDVVTALLR